MEANLAELLDVAARRWRLGQNAYGAVSWEGYRQHRVAVHPLDAEVERAIAAQDFLRAADVVEFGISLSLK
jgi:hypothetical protein